MSNEKNHAEKSSQSAGRAEDRVSDCPYDSDREARIASQGSSDGNFDSRSDRATCAGGHSIDGIVGGIVSQLIKDTQDRLAEVDECVFWYQKEKEKVEARLSDLQALAEMAQEILPEVQAESGADG